jgi:hypothetical protein
MEGSGFRVQGSRLKVQDSEVLGGSGLRVRGYSFLHAGCASCCDGVEGKGYSTRGLHTWRSAPSTCTCDVPVPALAPGTRARDSRRGTSPPPP